MQDVCHDVDEHISVHSLYGFISYYFYWCMFGVYLQPTGVCPFIDEKTERDSFVAT